LQHTSTKLMFTSAVSLIELVLPLDNIRVIDMTQVVSGPICTTLLGDFGADVIKVESPRGDELRYWSPGKSGLSGDFVGVNRNKRSIIIDLKEQAGKDLVYKLVEISDVFVENYRPGAMERLGFGYEKISSINPRIVYCSISGFGQTGPYAARPAYDPIIQAMSGLISMTGEKDRPPVKVALGVYDLFGGFFATIAILSALFLRNKTGRGTWLDISLLDVAVQTMTYYAGRYLASGTLPVRSGLAHAAAAPPNGGFLTKDGKYVMVSAHNDKHWQAFCHVINKPELLTDQRFSTLRTRNLHKQELLDILEPVFLQKTRDEWVKLFLDAGVPCGPVYTLDETLADPQVIHRQMVQEIDRNPYGKFRILVNPAKSSDPIWSLRLPPPLGGEHTRVILKDLLRLSDEEISSLMSKRIVADRITE